MSQAPGYRRRVGAAALVLLFACGCGPIEYVNQVTRKATTAVEAADAADADQYSPYWYTLSIEYLHKAREEAAASDFQAANRFGRKSEEAAVKAREEALRRASNPEAFEQEVGPAGGGDGVAPLLPEDDDEGDGEVPDSLRSEP